MNGHGNGSDSRIEVLCHAGYKGEERPIRFRLGETDHFIEEILDQWLGPGDAYFKVRVANDSVYTLRRSLLPDGGWALERYQPG